MHILMTGSDGQLGRALHRVLERTPGTRLSLWTINDHDITDPAAAGWIADVAPDVVINAAAWTDVDGAEANPALAFAVNTMGPKYLAEGCARCGAALVQLSTNEVFPGRPGVHYFEYDQPAAASVYARTKLASERAVAQVLPRHFIVRIAWLFGEGGNNFPTKIVAAADRLGGLRVVDDEFGNPTYAPDVAQAIAALIETERYGIYHLVNEGACSRFELAQQVLASAGRGHVPVTPIPSSEWPRPTVPPPHAVLVNLAGAAMGLRLRPWRDALDEYVRCELVPARP
jgi:dTDP-4-dehydrorhamnose reductase